MYSMLRLKNNRSHNYLEINALAWKKGTFMFDVVNFECSQQVTKLCVRRYV